MAVAVTPTTETTRPATPPSLAVSSLLGAVYVLGSIAVVAVGIPLLWASGVSTWLRPAMNSFVDNAGLLTVLVAAIGGLAVFGVTLLGPKPLHGLRAGSVFVGAGLLLSFFLAVGTGNIIRYGLLGGNDSSPFGLIGMAAVFAGLVVWGWSWMQTPHYVQTMEMVEDQGWFAWHAYKPMQAQRIRRATLLGILILIGSGIWTLVSHNSLPAGPWVVHVPFLARDVQLLPDARFTIPILLALAGLWVAYRAVNFPVFAEFLIATEAEMNKVTWASRRSLVQDTVVVLTTVLVFTLFLLFVDVAWYYILSNPYVGVLKIDTNKPKVVETTKTQDW